LFGNLRNLTLSLELKYSNEDLICQLVMPKLHKLIVHMESHDFRPLLMILRKFPHIKTLELHRNEESFAKCSNLECLPPKSLDLESLKVTGFKGELLSHFLVAMKCLKFMEVKTRGFNRGIFLPFANLATLETLEIHFFDGDLRTLSPLVNLKTLKIFRQRNHRAITNPEHPDCFKSVSKALEGLEHIGFHRCSRGKFNFVQVVLKNFTKLASFEVSECADLKDDITAMLRDGDFVCAYMCRLKIDAKLEITPQLFAKFVAMFPHLESLEMSGEIFDIEKYKNWQYFDLQMKKRFQGKWVNEVRQSDDLKSFTSNFVSHNFS
jgi:hypothetical protein